MIRHLVLNERVYFMIGLEFYEKYKIKKIGKRR